LSDTTFIPYNDSNQIERFILALDTPTPVLDTITSESTLPTVQVGNPSSTFAWIDASRIEVDEGYQRNLNEKRVHQIVRSFDPDVFGVVWVSEREDGSIACLDGQHRVAAALLLNPGQSVWVPSLVYTGLSSDDEARIFFKMNRHRLAPTAIDGWRARLSFNDPDVLAMKGILDQFGIEVVMGGTGGRIAFNQVIAVSEVEGLYKAGILPVVLTVIDEAWKGEKNAHKGLHMRGISVFLRTFNDYFADAGVGGLRMDRLITTLASLGVDGLERTAAFYRQSIGAPPSTALARAIHDRFNKGLSGKSRVRLPQWGIGASPDFMED
jgi:hypothetical protein